ncbi:hypothetical protein D3C72_1638430 [compost metagenome]
MAGRLFQITVQRFGPAWALAAEVQYTGLRRLYAPSARLAADLAGTADHQLGLDMAAHGRERSGTDQQQRANGQQQERFHTASSFSRRRPWQLPGDGDFE